MSSMKEELRVEGARDALEEPFPYRDDRDMSAMLLAYGGGAFSDIAICGAADIGMSALASFLLFLK